MDPDTRRLMMFAGGLGGLLVVMIGASALVSRHSSEVPVVLADTRPIREKPAKAGGMKIDGAENDVFSGLSDAADAKLAPAAETPDTKAFQAVEAPHPAITPPVADAPTEPAPAIVAKTPPATVAPAPAVVARSPAPLKPQGAVADTHPAAGAHPAMVQLAAYAKTLYAALNDEQRRTADRMLASTLPQGALTVAPAARAAPH